MERARVGRGERMLASVGLLAVVLVGCARAPSVEVSTGAVPPPVPVTSGEPTSSFQGAVASIDLAAGKFVVDVQIVWTPVLKAERESRRVVVDPRTRWEPVQTGLGSLLVRDEVQVEAHSRPDGTWEARRIQLFDIE